MDNAPIKENIFKDSESKINSSQWVNWFTKIVSFINVAPKISSGTSAPTSTPGKVGDIYCDTSNSKVYIATGISSSSDWKVLN
jgi:hypothetical protein